MPFEYWQGDRSFRQYQCQEYEDLVDRLVARILILRDRIRQDLGLPDWNWGAVYCIGKGGFSPGVALAEALDVPIASDVAQRQGGPQQSADEPLAGVRFARHISSLVELQSGMNILVAEDLTESGTTLVEALTRLEKMGIDPGDTTTCAIWHKVTSEHTPLVFVEEVGIDPDTGHPPYIVKPGDRFENPQYREKIKVAEIARMACASD